MCTRKLIFILWFNSIEIASDWPNDRPPNWEIILPITLKKKKQIVDSEQLNDENFGVEAIHFSFENKFIHLSLFHCPRTAKSTSIL